MGEQTILGEVLKLGTEVGKFGTEVSKLSIQVGNLAKLTQENAKTLKRQGEILADHTQLLTENTEVLHFIEENMVMREEFEDGMNSVKEEFTRLEQKVDDGFVEVKADFKDVKVYLQRIDKRTDEDTRVFGADQEKLKNRVKKLENQVGNFRLVHS